MTLRIRLFGRPELERDGDVVRLDGRKTWALLAYVLLESPAPTRRQLVDRLWSDADDPLGAVRWALSQVRKALAPDATITEAGGHLVIEGRFTADACELLAGGWSGESIDELTRGDLLDGVETVDSPDFDRWLSLQRARTATARTDALRSCAAACVRTDPLRALQLAERALAAEPFDDALHELVVAAHVARGDLDAARRYADATTDRYRRELGTAPQTLRHPLERPSDAARPLLRLDIEARALLEAGAARSAAGAWDDARDITMRAIDAAAASGDGVLEIRGIVSFLNIATCRMSRGESEWQPLLQRALALGSELGDPALLCDIEIEHGRLASIVGRYGAAEAMLRRGIAIARELDDPLRLATAQRLLGIVETERGELEAAEKDLRAAATHPERRAASMAYLARLLLLRARHEEVEHILDDQANWSGPDAIVWRPLAIIAAGHVRFARGDLAGASERFGAALTISRETRDPDWTVLAMRGLAQVDHADERPERAMTTLRQALAITTTHRGGRRWCEAVVLADLVEWSDGAERAHVDRGLALTRSAPMPDLIERFARYARGHTLLHTAAS